MVIDGANDVVSAMVVFVVSFLVVVSIANIVVRGVDVLGIEDAFHSLLLLFPPLSFAKCTNKAVNNAIMTMPRLILKIKNVLRSSNFFVIPKETKTTISTQIFDFIELEHYGTNWQNSMKE